MSRGASAMIRSIESRRPMRALFLLAAAGTAPFFACSSSSPDGSAGGATGGHHADGGASATGGEGTGGYPAGGGDTAGGAGGASGAGGDPGGGGSSDGGTPAMGGLGGASGGGGSGGGTFEACGPEPALELQGPAVPPVIMLDEPAPVPTGGALVDGIYDLVSFVFYEEFPLESLAQDFRQVIRVRDGGVMIDSFQVARGNPAAWSYAVSEVEGPQMTITVTCPSIYVGVAQPQMYSANPGEVIMFIDHWPGIAVARHVLRE